MNFVFAAEIFLWLSQTLTDSDVQIKLMYQLNLIGPETSNSWNFSRNSFDANTNRVDNDNLGGQETEFFHRMKRCTLRTLGISCLKDILLQNTMFQNFDL